MREIHRITINNKEIELQMKDRPLDGLIEKHTSNYDEELFLTINKPENIISTKK